jgi:phytoene dehydrogenase-like protein
MSKNEAGIVIVGGGLAGLTTACYLARDSLKVTVFEKSSMLGGRGTSSDSNEYRFNRGIHAIYTGGAMTEVLEELAIPYSGGTPKVAHILHEGKLYPAPFSTLSLLTNRLLGLRDKMELVRLFRSIARTNPVDVANISVQQWLNDRVRRPRVLSFMTAYAWTTTYCSALDVVSAEVFILKTQLTMRHPVVYVDGGWQTLVEGLSNSAKSRGAQIFKGTSVEAIEEKNGRASGVRLQNGKYVDASAVVLAVSPRETARLIPNLNGAALDKIVEGFTPARVACLDVALKSLPNPKYGIVQDLDHPRFMSTQSLYSQIAPEGGALIYTFKQLDPNHPTDPHQDERELEEFLDSTQRGWRDVLIKKQFLPRIEAVGMLPTATSVGYRGRPGPEAARIPNLYVAGDWVGSGFLADPCFSSARDIAHLIIRKKRREDMVTSLA